MVSVNVAIGRPGDNAITVRIDGRVVRTWQSSATRGDFEDLHRVAHRIALHYAAEFMDEVVCRWCEIRSGEGGIR
jgi:hypothetical protein